MLSEYIVCHINNINLGNVFKRLEHIYIMLPVSFTNSKQ